jgi:hypothetical protein
MMPSGMRTTSNSLDEERLQRNVAPEIGMLEGGETGEAPPNLRDSGGEAGSCGVCAAYSREGCGKYGGYPCRPNQICDEFEGA